MRDSAMGLRASLQRLGQTWKELLFGFVTERPPLGSAPWLQYLNEDVAQAQRNARDLEYVLVRQGVRIRSARDEEARWGEEFAMAYIEARAGLAPEARMRVDRALDQGVLPLCVAAIIPTTIGKAYGDHGRDALDRALVRADAIEHRDLAMGLLMETAKLERRRKDAAAEQAALREGLRRLGWGVGGDPYRTHKKPRTDLEDWERIAVVWCGSQALSSLAKAGAFEEADAMLDELRACAAGAKEARTWTTFLLDQQAWLAYHRGDPTTAAQAWSDVLTAPSTTAKSPAAQALVRLNIGFAHLRRGAPAEAAAQATVVLDEAEDASVLTRAHSLLAEAALASETPAKARKHAELALTSSSPLTRSAGGRVLAELAMLANEATAALSLARDSVEEAHRELGEDPFLGDRLLTLARAATTLDPELARATLGRVEGLPLPRTHPVRREAALALRQLGGG